MPGWTGRRRCAALTHLRRPRGDDRPGRTQVWGFQARRINAWKNELSFLTRLPPELGMGRGIFAASLAPAIVGLEAPEPSKNLELKPYARADLATNREAAPPISNQLVGDAGLDVKYGATQNLNGRPDVQPRLRPGRR